MYSKDNSISKQSETTIGLIKKLQADEFLKYQNRNCISYRDLREQDEDFVD
jgi:hypothetical protein